MESLLWKLQGSLTRIKESGQLASHCAYKYTKPTVQGNLRGIDFTHYVRWLYFGGVRGGDHNMCYVQNIIHLFLKPVIY